MPQSLDPATRNPQTTIVFCRKETVEFSINKRTMPVEKGQPKAAGGEAGWASALSVEIGSTSATSQEGRLRPFRSHRPGIYAGFIDVPIVLGGAGVRGDAADPRTAEILETLNEPGINAGPITACGGERP